MICSDLDPHLIGQDNRHCDHIATIWKYNEFLNFKAVVLTFWICDYQILLLVLHMIYFFSATMNLRSSRSDSPSKTYGTLTRVSVQGVESLWDDCRFIPADWGS